MKKLNIEIHSFITVDLICYGPTYPSVAEQYINWLEKKFHSRINEFSVRYKNPYWTPKYLYARFDNGKVYCKPFGSTDYGVAFSEMSLSKCYYCDFKGDKHTSDITIGDYWGVEKSDIAYNVFGTSIAFVHSECGKDFIESLKEEFYLYSADVKKALDNNPAYSISRPKKAKYDIFKQQFNKYGLKRAVKKTSSFKTKIGRIIPLRVKKILKKIHK